MENTMPKIKHKDVNLNVRISSEMRDQLAEVARQMDLPASQVVRGLIADWLRANYQPPRPLE
jgi:antitoxin component of RelBE/YafQ-DinJ toxin-antitoxin module